MAGGLIIRVTFIDTLQQRSTPTMVCSGSAPTSGADRRPLGRSPTPFMSAPAPPIPLLRNRCDMGTSLINIHWLAPGSFWCCHFTSATCLFISAFRFEFFHSRWSVSSKLFFICMFLDLFYPIELGAYQLSSD